MQKQEEVSVQASESVKEEKTPATQVHPTDQEESSAIDEERYQKERKRKGKAPLRKKPNAKKARTQPTAVTIREPGPRNIKEEDTDSDEQDDSYSMEDQPTSEEEVSMDDEEYEVRQINNKPGELVHPPQELLEYQPWHVNLDDELMDRIKQFASEKFKEAFDGKDEGSKRIKCGKVLHHPSLDQLVARTPFLNYLHAMGFDWLIENEDPNIPVRVAKEFFTTFKFKVTTDLDEESISFRVFGLEMSMSIIEWTVRLGMCTLEEALSPGWRERERGIPRRHVDFDPQAAWEELTHPGSGEFVTTQSRSTHFHNPVLRLVQLYLDFNLLGQSNSAVRTSMTELYLLWCAWRNRSLHLGFWTAYQCHLIATHPARNLSLCNISGAFVRHNIIITASPDLSPMFMVHPPPPFDTSLFVRTNTVFMRDGVPRFYAMGEAVVPAGRAPRANVQVQSQARARPRGQADDQEGRHQRIEAVVEEMAIQNRETRHQVDRLAQMMEGFLKTFAGIQQASKAEPSNSANKASVEPEKEDEDDFNREDDEQESKEDDDEQSEETQAEPTTLRRSQRSIHKPD